MKTDRYSSAGLVIDSAFPLVGLASADGGTETPHLRFLRAPSRPEPRTAPDIVGVNWAYDGAVFDLAVPGVAEFRIATDGTVSVWPTTDDETGIPSFLIGSVLGIALHLRGVIALHASAVAVGDGAALFCGASGAGKSTMAAALHRRGYEVLADDLCAIEMGGERPVMHPDGRKLKLWDRAIGEVGLEEGKGEAVREGFEKYFVDIGNGAGRSVPVRAIYALTTERGLEVPTVEPVPLSDAAALIRRNAYRPFLVRRLRDEALYFRAAAMLLREARLGLLKRDHDFDQMDRVVETLRAHWRETGLE